jgi:threonine dehydratase
VFKQSITDLMRATAPLLKPWVRNEYLQRILSARVYDVALDTPLMKASTLSKRTGHNILFKREDLQPVFSFKLRGAYNCLANLTEKQQQAGVVACSAGNHAQGVALSASKLNLDATIIMPTGTPNIKVDAVRSHGGNVVLHGDTFDDAQEEALRLVQEEGRTLIHPFDDPYVIAGQGTIATEILKERNGKPLDAIFVCCGGGGMLAGIASYVKSVRPEVKVIGVEAEDAAGMTESLRQGKGKSISKSEGVHRVYGKHCSLTFLFFLLPLNLFHYLCYVSPSILKHPNKCFF